jgi:hypothetical protein
MGGTIIEQTQAFIAQQREALLKQRDDLSDQQQKLQRQLDELNEILGKFDVFEGKRTPRRPRQSGGPGEPRVRRGPKREDLLQVIREGHGLSRGEILEKVGLKGDKAGEMSVSNRLTALTKSNQVVRENGKYRAA